jgi:hypothetical protein
MDMKVKNLNGATPNKSSSGTWLAHWEKCSGQKADMCFAYGCVNTPSVGGQVQKDSPSDKSWYVIPLCDDCNKKKGQDLDIWDTAKLVSVNVIETLEISSVTPRNFAQWATDRFPEGRLFR